MWKECCFTAVQPHLSSGTVAPLSRTTVGNRSMLLVGSSTCLPPGIFPGQRRIPGTRIPPSQFVDFPAAQRNEKNTKSPSLPITLNVWSRNNTGVITKRTTCYLRLARDKRAQQTVAALQNSYCSLNQVCRVQTEGLHQI